MTRWKDDNIERAIDGKQDGLQGNRLRLFVASHELAIRRRWFKGTMLPLAVGRGAKLIGFRAGLDIIDGLTPGQPPRGVIWAGGDPGSRAGQPPFVPDGELLPSRAALAWLECRTWAIFAHVALTWQESLGWTFDARPLYQTPQGVDPVSVLGFERSLIAGTDPRILAQYETWLTLRAGAGHWSRAAWVRDELDKVLCKAGVG